MANVARIRVNSQFRPRRPTSGRDCGVAATEELIRHGSRKKIVIGPDQVRDRMGNQNDPTTPLQVKKAVESIDKEAKAKGLKPLKYKLAGKWVKVNGVDLISSGASRQSIIARAKKGELIHFVVDYAKVNRKYPWLSGSRSFNGLHATWGGGYAPGLDENGKPRLGIRKQGSQWQILYADPTWNRPGTPKGPKWVKLSVIWDITDGAWSSKGGTGWVGGSTPASPRLTPEVPEVKPDPCEAKVENLEDELEELEIALAESRDLIDELQKRRLPRALVERLVALADEFDELLPPVDGVPDSAVASGVGTNEA